MRFILRTSTPVHDVYLKEGEEPKRAEMLKDLIGFTLSEPQPEIHEMKKK